MYDFDYGRMRLLWKKKKKRSYIDGKDTPDLGDKELRYGHCIVRTVEIDIFISYSEIGKTGEMAESRNQEISPRIAQVKMSTLRIN